MEEDRESMEAQHRLSYWHCREQTDSVVVAEYRSWERRTVTEIVGEEKGAVASGEEYRRSVSATEHLETVRFAEARRMGYSVAPEVVVVAPW